MFPAGGRILPNHRQIHKEQGRAQCLNRNLCMRGCPLGGYFSSVSSTLPWAAKTGNLNHPAVFRRAFHYL